MISTPLGLYDCDVPCDGAVAIIISARETAADLKQTPVVSSMRSGTQITERQSWDQGTMTHLPNAFGPAAHLWSRASVTHDGRRRRRALRRLQLQHRHVARGARLLRASARPRTSSRAASGSRSTASCRSTPTAASCRPAVPTATASCTRRSTQLRGDAGERQIKDAQVAVCRHRRRRPGRSLPLHYGGCDPS